MRLSEFVSRFQNPKKNGGGYMVKCPCHGDNRQSLSISEGRNGIVLNCFAGCSPSDIVRAVGLEMKDLFNDSLSCSKIKRPPTVEYVYSENLKKVRFAKFNQGAGKWEKSFCWKHKDEYGKWQNGKGDFKVPLYKQDLLKSTTDKDTVYIVEGEKDCDTMTDKLGLIAVSPPNGASKSSSQNKWNSEYSSLLRGKNVAVVPDNDDIGRAYAELVADNILSQAKSVKIISLSDEWVNLKEKGDITDVYENEQPYGGKSAAEAVRFKLEVLTDFTKPYKRRAAEKTAVSQSKPQKKSLLPEFDFEALRRHKANDIGTAEFFSSLVRSFMCYVPEERAFYIYNGTVWVKDDVKQDLITGKILMEFVTAAQRLIPERPAGVPREWTHEEAEEENINKAYREQYKYLGGTNKRDAILRDIKKILRKSRSEFDRQPELLNCKNCTYNLETGKAQPHRASDFITKCTNADYDENAHSERFESFIDEICEGDEERKTALQTALGYSLMGATPEECFFIAYGKTTRNGKGTLFDLVLDTVGDYGLQMDFETIARTSSKDGSRATPDLARLIGVRYALVNEPQKGTCFNEGLVKQLTGSDDINARPLYGAVIQFKPLFTIFISTNNLPAVADDTLFASDRIRILPFEKHFSREERDTHLKQRLREGNGREAVLNWLVKGYEMYKRNGLTDTKAGNAVLRQYRSENDYTRQFIDECLVVLEQSDIHAHKTRLTDIQQEYNCWCKMSNIKPLGKKLFKEELEKHGINVFVHCKQYVAKVKIIDNHTVNVY